MPLLQEEFQYDSYKLLIACIMLNQTSNKHVRKVIYSFFDKWPTPDSVIKANEEDIKNHIKPLGFFNRRTKTIKRFTEEFKEKKFSLPSELYGIGKYGDDSYEIFINGNLSVKPTDGILKEYLKNYFSNEKTTNI